jgi:hypothetical protein
VGPRIVGVCTTGCEILGAIIGTLDDGIVRTVGLVIGLLIGPIKTGDRGVVCGVGDDGTVGIVVVGDGILLGVVITTGVCMVGDGENE